MAGRAARALSGRGGRNLSSAFASVVRLDLGRVTYRHKAGISQYLQLTSEPSGAPSNIQEDTMNSIIYIVGLVVIIGVILSYFGFR